MINARHIAFGAISLRCSNRAAQFDGTNPCIYLSFAAHSEGDSTHSDCTSGTKGFIGLTKGNFICVGALNRCALLMITYISSSQIDTSAYAYHDLSLYCKLAIMICSLLSQNWVVIYVWVLI